MTHFNPSLYDMMREENPGGRNAHLRTRECIVYWHREKSTDDCWVWIVDAVTEELVRERNWPFADPQVCNFIPFVHGAYYYVPTKIVCKHWPSLDAWRKRRDAEIAAGAKQVPRETPEWSWIKLGVTMISTDEIKALKAELEAADEIEEALTMRIEELRAELAQKRWGINHWVEEAARESRLRMKDQQAIRRLLRERNNARAEIDRLKTQLAEARKLADSEAASAQRRIGAQSTLITQLHNEIEALKMHARTAAEHRDRIDHGFFFDMLINAIYNAGRIGT